MISKNEVKYIQSLSDKKNRDRDDVFVAEGPKLVNELLANGMTAKMIYTTEDLPDYKVNDFNIKKISAAELQRISRFETANKISGIFYRKKLPVLQLQNTITLALDGIQDPGNLGTIIRTADWFGITQIIASTDTADCYNAKVVQSTMGSIARVHVYYTNLLSLFTDAIVPVTGALLNGKNLYEVSILQEGIIVIGNESKGIRSHLLPFIGQAIAIPRRGKTESLNAAVATGIILSHLIK